MHNFNRYTAEINRFKRSKAYRLHYTAFIGMLKNNGSPILSKEIEASLGIRGVIVRSLVQFARRTGIPVASSEDGYYIAKSYNDLAGTLRHLRERSSSLYYTLYKMERIFENRNQFDLFDSEASGGS